MKAAVEKFMVRSSVSAPKNKSFLRVSGKFYVVGL